VGLDDVEKGLLPVQEIKLGFCGPVKGKVVPVLNLIKHYAMKAYGGVDV
jgi:hypothetical protein